MTEIALSNVGSTLISLMTKGGMMREMHGCELGIYVTLSPSNNSTLEKHETTIDKGI